MHKTPKIVALTIVPEFCDCTLKQILRVDRSDYSLIHIAMYVFIATDGTTHFMETKWPRATHSTPQFLNLILIRFSKIAIQGKGPGGKWTRKQLASRESNIFNICVIRPPEM